MIEEPERSFVPGTSVYLKDSTDDTQTCSPPNETLQQSHGLSNSDCRKQGKSVCYSVNWTAGDTQLELVVRGVSGMPLYCEAKQAAGTYQTVKLQWLKGLQEAGLGTWVRKPPEQENFTLTL
ncbi:hypothetical protein cypCar_00026145 [Cyprinus carpio]|nr:hypothetical protein cypCar_00026145 [Cyprinus carpio]